MHQLCRSHLQTEAYMENWLTTNTLSRIFFSTSDQKGSRRWVWCGDNTNTYAEIRFSNSHQMALLGMQTDN